MAQINEESLGNFVLVKVVAYQNDKAFCKARFNGSWHKIVMDKSSLERADHREGDTFEWILNHEGVVKGQDIRCHPRRANVGEKERADRAFAEPEALARNPAA